jgi:hypothetical protein
MAPAQHKELVSDKSTDNVQAAKKYLPQLSWQAALPAVGGCGRNCCFLLLPGTLPHCSHTGTAHRLTIYRAPFLCLSEPTSLNTIGEHSPASAADHDACYTSFCSNVPLKRITGADMPAHLSLLETAGRREASALSHSNASSMSRGIPLKGC